MFRILQTLQYDGVEVPMVRKETRKVSKEHKMKVLEGHVEKSGLCPRGDKAQLKGYKVRKGGCMLCCECVERALAAM